MIFAAEECWVRPNEFIPERWYSRPELIKNKNAFVPFSFGNAPVLLVKVVFLVSCLVGASLSATLGFEHLKYIQL